MIRLTLEDMEEIKDPAQQEVSRLVAEVERLKQYIRDYSTSVVQKLEGVDAQLVEFEQENARLLTVKEGLSVERDACLGLIGRLALAAGLKAGTVNGNRFVVDLPAGQVSWQFNADEAHLFQELPAYSGTIEEMEIEEKYRRVMNPDV